MTQVVWCHGVSFSAKSDYDFVEWDFTNQGQNSNADEADELFGILENMGKEVYMAIYQHLGATACRILGTGLLRNLLG